MLKSVQSCRAVAALLVVLFHTSGSIFALPKYFGSKPYGQIFDFGGAGVDFFFVLSGFIMMHVHSRDLGQPREIAPYLWKRFTRIYPAYWVALALVAPVYFLMPQFGFGWEREPDVILRAFFLFPHPQTHMVLGVAWTLVYEMFFYLLFGLLILNKRLGILIFLTWTVCVLGFAMFKTFPWTFIFSHYYIRFLAGLAVALLLQRSRIPLPRTIASIGVAVFLTTGLIVSYSPPATVTIPLIGFTLGSALALAGLVEAERSGMIRPWAWLVYLGNASYAIYLLHFPALSAIAKIGAQVHIKDFLPNPITFWIYVFGAVAAGCIFHHLVEHPIHEWAKTKFRRSKREPTPAGIAVG